MLCGFIPMELGLAVLLSCSLNKSTDKDTTRMAGTWRKHGFWGTFADRLSFGILVAHTTLTEVLEGWVLPGPLHWPFSWFLWLILCMAVIISSWISAAIIFLFVQSPLERLGLWLVGLK